MHGGEVGEVVCCEESQGEDKEGGCVEGCFLHEGVVKIRSTK